MKLPDQGYKAVHKINITGYPSILIYFDNGADSFCLGLKTIKPWGNNVVLALLVISMKSSSVVQYLQFALLKCHFTAASQLIRSCHCMLQLGVEINGWVLGTTASVILCGQLLLEWMKRSHLGELQVNLAHLSCSVEAQIGGRNGTFLAV